MAFELLDNIITLQQRSNRYAYPATPITEIIANGFFTVDRRWTVKYWNKSAEKLLGVKAQDIVGQNLWEKFAGTIPLNFYTVYHKAFLQDVPIYFEEYWGEMGAWFEVVTCHCEDELSVSFKNKSELPEVSSPAKTLEMFNQLYRFVTEITNDCLWEWNLQTKEFFWIDGGHKRVFGFQIENALIPQSFWESRIHPDDKVRVLERINKMILEGTACDWEEEYRFKAANGKYLYVHDRGHIIYDKNKRPSRMIGATEDITARKQTEMQLLETERKLSVITRQTMNALIIADTEGKVTWVNDSFTRITGYKLEEVTGRRMGSFLQGKDTNPTTLQYLRTSIKNKKAFDCEILNYSKSGNKHWVYVQGQPLLNEKQVCDQYLICETDITEKILLEEKIVNERITKHREITDAVLTALENQRAEIGRELHDNLNQTLALAKLNIQMAKRNEKDRELYLGNSCNFIMNVIEEIRRISKSLIIPGMFGIGLFDHIKNLIVDVMGVQPIKIEFLQNGLHEEDLDDKIQLTIFRIVQEQVNNILTHSKATFATIDLSRHMNQVRLRITDNGEGCDILKEKKGVGLFNIQSRVELYNGRVAIESKPGEGYELTVILPVTPRI
jgi:PAS domain S-box-containing protein